MRIIKKYKIYTKTRKILEYPTRILKFKRPKWYYIKRQINKLRRPRFLNLQNCVRILLSVGRWSNLKWSHNNKVLSNRSLLVYFNNNKPIYRLLKLKNVKKRLDALKKHFRSQFFLEIFLFRQKLVNSTFESHLFLKTKKIIVNDKTVSKSLFLKKGDFVSFKDSAYCYQKTSQKFSSARHFDTFLESDYYSQTFSIFKDCNSLSYNDITLSLTSNMSLN